MFFMQIFLNVYIALATFRVLAIVSGSPHVLQPQTFTLGYLTGSDRLPNDKEYKRPGLLISGAITYAVEEVNKHYPLHGGHKLDFKVAETCGQEDLSILQTAKLWISNVSAYIGPQETCVHEAKMASSFNLPMISYVTFFYNNSPDEDFGPVALTVLRTLEAHNITVVGSRKWEATYHHGYDVNPFVEMVSETYLDSRIFVVLGHYYEFLGLMSVMHDKGLFDEGKYFVVGVTLRQYNPNKPGQYLRDLLKEESNITIMRSYQNFVGVVPTPSINFDEFAAKVNIFLEKPPFNHPNPLQQVGGIKKIRAEAAYLYDAVHLYARALNYTLKEREHPFNGSLIISKIRGTTYFSAMGYMVHMDVHAEAEGNYTLIGWKKHHLIPGEYGLYPMGGFRYNSDYSGLPELHLSESIPWRRGEAPIDEPSCGFRGEKCQSLTGEIIAGVSGGVILLLLVIFIVTYKNWRYEQELDSLLWKIDYREIEIKEDASHQTNKLNKGLGARENSQLSLLSNAEDLDVRTISGNSTQIGVYRGQVVALKRFSCKSVDVTRTVKKEMKTMRDLRHDNLLDFVGACIEPPNARIVTEYCSRGSLKDILRNEDVKLDNMLLASLVADILQGMIYLHDSPIKSHGNLNTLNCLVDSRWVLKISDFGLQALKAGTELGRFSCKFSSTDCEEILYRAPELLRNSTAPLCGTQKGDVYSFAIVLYEIHGREGPFGPLEEPVLAVARKVIAVPQHGVQLKRPPIDSLGSCLDCVISVMAECWAENPEDRPDFRTIRTKLRPMRKGIFVQFLQNFYLQDSNQASYWPFTIAKVAKVSSRWSQTVFQFLARMQGHAEVELKEVHAPSVKIRGHRRILKKYYKLKRPFAGIDALLHQMLPSLVAEQLKRGHKVEAESHDAVTIYFSDIVGFTEMSAESTPLQVVDFLNDLYTCFDSIIGNYDVYKVETIGDAYMVVSGLPIRNGDQHASEIASMSLHLLKAIQLFKIRHRPNDTLKLRIGIHSGPVCAGVVGLKMPRYCLFGDTVNTASRMESTGLALKIHCSCTCVALLQKLGGYILEERGQITVKGKGEMTTYWLLGEEETKIRRKKGCQTSVELVSPSFSAFRNSFRNRSISRSNVQHSTPIGTPRQASLRRTSADSKFKDFNLLEESHLTSSNASFSPLSLVTKETEIYSKSFSDLRDTSVPNPQGVPSDGLFKKKSEMEDMTKCRDETLPLLTDILTSADGVYHLPEKETQV